MIDPCRIKYAGTVDGCAFTYEDGELRVRCKPQYALRMLLEMEPQYCEHALPPGLPQDVAAPGGSADAATRTAEAVPGSGGKDVALRSVIPTEVDSASAQLPAGATPTQEAEVIPLRPQGPELPEHVRQSPTLKPVVVWYLTEHPAWTDEQLLRVLEAQRPELKCLRHIKDLAERVRVTADVVRNPNPGPKEGS